MVRPPWNRKADGPSRDVTTEPPVVTTAEVSDPVETDKCMCVYIYIYIYIYIHIYIYIYLYWFGKWGYDIIYK